MSDPVIKPSEGAEKVDLTKYVPKDDHEKTLNTVKDLESKLEDAKLSLLDPDYISFLETKKGKGVVKKVEKAVREVSDDDLDGLSSKDLLALSVERAVEAVKTEISNVYDEQLKKMGGTLSDVLAILELQEVEKKYKDFDDFRGETRKILETSQTPLTIEQAYKLAKQANEEKPDDDTTKKKKAAASTEKPSGTVAKGSIEPKDFKDKVAAGEDAWDKTVGAGKDTL